MHQRYLLADAESHQHRKCESYCGCPACAPAAEGETKNGGTNAESGTTKAADEASVREFVETIYCSEIAFSNGLEADCQTIWDNTKELVEPELAKQYLKVREYAMKKEEEGIYLEPHYHPLVGGNGPFVQEFSILKVGTEGDQAKAYVKFLNNGEPERPIIHLIRNSDGWLLYDVTYDGDDTGYSWREAMMTFEMD